MTRTSADLLSDTELEVQLRERGVRNLLFTMIDQAGILRVKMLPVERVPAAIKRGVGFSLTSALLLCSDDAIADIPEFPQARGDVRLFADYDALRMLDLERGLAWAPANQFTPEGDPFAVCQRAALAAQERRAEALGLDFRVAFELEFTLFTGTPDKPALAHSGPAYGLTPILALEEWATDVLATCKTANLEVEQLHPEYGQGQVELSLRPRTPMKAVDEYVLTRLIVSRVSQAHGMMVSFAPITTVGGIGNGCHIHFSTLRDGENVFADSDTGQGIRPTGGQLIAGLVRHLPASIAMLAPSVNSYDRLQPGHFSGAYACWGVENREAAIRYIPGVAGRRSQGANIEVKCADNATNPYLAAATIMACALRGVDDDLEVPLGITELPDSLDAETAAAGQVTRLPEDLGAALDALAGNDMLREAFGDSMVDTYIAIRKREWDAYADTSIDERVALLRWKF